MLISDNIEQLNNVWTSTEILKYFDLPFDLLFLDRLKDLNDAFLIIVNIDAFKDLTIFTSSNFSDNFIVILFTPLHGERLVVPILLGALDVDVGVDPRLRHDDGSRGDRGGARTRDGEEGGRERRYDDGRGGRGLGDAGGQAVPRQRTDHAAAIVGGEAGRARVSAGGSEGDTRPVAEMVDPALLRGPALPKKEVVAAFHVALACTEVDPELRPRMKAVADNLDKIGS